MTGHADASDVSTAELKVGGFAVSDEELRGFLEDDDYCNIRIYYIILYYIILYYIYIIILHPVFVV